MTSYPYLAKAYLDGRSPGDPAPREEVHRTIALCHIADMLTAIAYDIRALRETNPRKGDTE